MSAPTELREIYLTLPPNVDRVKLREILEKNPGGSAVYFKNSGKWQRQNLKISNSAELQNFLGAENVRIY